MKKTFLLGVLLFVLGLANQGCVAPGYVEAVYYEPAYVPPPAVYVPPPPVFVHPGYHCYPPPRFHGGHWRHH